jgi:hypothetical protein
MFLWLVWRTALETFSPGWFLTFQQKAVAKLAAQAWGVSQVGHITVVRSEAQSGEIDRAQISSLVAGISLDVAINRGLYFWAYRLQCYSQSQLSSVFNCITYARVFLSAVLTNWLVNTSILKIDVRQFQFSDYPSHVRMLYYSLSALVLNDGGGVAPLGDLAWVSRLAWGIFGILVLVTFLANIVFVWTRERDDAMLKSTVDELKRRAREHDAAFKEQMEVGVAEAARRLLALQGAFGWLLKFVIEGVPPEFMADATE